MKNTTVFEKSLKIVLPKIIIIVPFVGNLTDRKKNEITEKVQTYYSNQSKKLDFEKLKKVIFYHMYGTIEKDMKVTRRDNKTDLSGKGWGSSNMNTEDVVLLD